MSRAADPKALVKLLDAELSRLHVQIGDLEQERDALERVRARLLDSAGPIIEAVADEVSSSTPAHERRDDPVGVEPIVENVEPKVPAAPVDDTVNEPSPVVVGAKHESVRVACKFSGRADWHPDEEEVLRKHYPAGGRQACVPHLPGRTLKAISIKASKLGLKLQEDASASNEPPPKLDSDPTPAPAVLPAADASAVPEPAPAKRPSATAPREPASLPKPAPARTFGPGGSAQPKASPAPCRFSGYAERLANARSFLESKGFSVQRHDREAAIAQWRVSGYSGLFSNEQLMAFADERRGAAAA